MMSLEARGFVIHDLGKFPIVSIRSDAVVPGYARHWAMEMDALINHGVPFAIVYRGAPLSETAADLAHREDWFQRNQRAIARLFRVQVVVEPDKLLRERARMNGRNTSKIFGIPHRAVGTMKEAAGILFNRVGVGEFTGLD